MFTLETGDYDIDTPVALRRTDSVYYDGRVDM